MESKIVNGYTLKYLLEEGSMAEVWYAENRIEKNGCKSSKKDFMNMRTVILQEKQH